MKDFKQYLKEQNLGASAEDAIGVIKGLNGRLTSRQWDQLIALINKFANKAVDDEDSVQPTWNQVGSHFGPPDQIVKRDPVTLPPS